MVRPETLIAAALVALFSGCSNASEPTPVAVDATEETKVEGLIQPEQLLHWPSASPAPFIVDVRPITAYRHGHIPGAIQLWRDGFTRSDLPFTGMAATRGSMRELLDSLGLHPDQTVVAYDDRGNCEAARLWWLLTIHGHPNVVLLDGGYQRWLAEDRPTDLGWVSTLASGYHFPSVAESTLVATLPQVQRAALKHHGIVLDTRTTEEYSGAEQRSGAFRAGTIPGSIHYDWLNSVDIEKDHCLKDVATLRAQFAALGITAEDTVFTFCHSGVRSAHATFVLTRILGMQNVRNYDGSWTEWSYHGELPAQVGGSVEKDLP